MKDFYDLMVLFRHPTFNLTANIEVIHSVFNHRNTVLPEKLIYDSQAITTLSRNWSHFLNTLENEFQENVPKGFTDVISQINQMIKLL
jgi:hypothetical protein